MGDLLARYVTSAAAWDSLDHVLATFMAAVVIVTGMVLAALGTER